MRPKKVQDIEIIASLVQSFRSKGYEGTSLLTFDLKIKNGIKKWIYAFEKIGSALGLSEQKAHKSAMNTLIKIQGSLIVTKGFNDLTVFKLH